MGETLRVDDGKRMRKEEVAFLSEFVPSAAQGAPASVTLHLVQGTPPAYRLRATALRQRFSFSAFSPHGYR